MSTDQDQEGMQENQGSNLLLPRAPAAARKYEYDDVGTGSKMPRIEESPKRNSPPLNAGRVCVCEREHNDELLLDPGFDDIDWETLTQR